MRLRVLAATTALVAASAPAFAQKAGDTPPDPTPVIVETAPIAPFAGGYAGAQLGYSFADTDTSNLDPNDPSVADRITNPGATLSDVQDAINAIGEDGAGFAGGLHTGYLWQNGNLVYGAEASYDFTDIEVDNNLGDINGQGALKGKLGYAFDRTMVYGTAGAVYGDADFLGTDYNDWGYGIGAGVDYLVTDRVSVGAEALYSDYGEFDDSNVDVSLTTVTARVSYRF